MTSIYINAVTSENEGKIEYIYRNYYSFMAYTASGYLKDRSDIEDAVHDAMLKIIGIIDRIDEADTLRTKNLCGVIAKNTAIDKLRAKSSKFIEFDAAYDIPSDPSDGPEQISVNNESFNILIKAIDSLGDIYRDVVRLKYISDLKEREIAELLGLPPKTVNQRIFRAKRILRQALKEVR